MLRIVSIDSIPLSFDRLSTSFHSTNAANDCHSILLHLSNATGVKVLNSSSENESTADPIRLPLAGNGVGRLQRIRCLHNELAALLSAWRACAVYVRLFLSSTFRALSSNFFYLICKNLTLLVWRLLVMYLGGSSSSSIFVSILSFFVWGILSFYCAFFSYIIRFVQMTLLIDLSLLLVRLLYLFFRFLPRQSLFDFFLKFSC